MQPAVRLCKAFGQSSRLHRLLTHRLVSSAGLQFTTDNQESSSGNNGEAQPGAIPCIFQHKDTSQLWQHYQAATESLDSPTDVGFLDVVVFGAQTTGKSTLLGKLTGLTLPMGKQTVTKCPIRIVVNPKLSGTFLAAKLPRTGQEYRVRLTDNVLDVETYRSAIRKLNIDQGKGDVDAMTDIELQVVVGQQDALPLNVVDLPGFTSYRPQQESSSTSWDPVDSIVISILGGSGDNMRPLLPIMTCKATDTDLVSTRVHFVEGRPFLTVFTHTDLLQTDTTVSQSRLPHCCLQSLHGAHISLHLGWHMALICSYFIRCPRFSQLT